MWEKYVEKMRNFTCWGQIFLGTESGIRRFPVLEPHESSQWSEDEMKGNLI